MTSQFYVAISNAYIFSGNKIRLKHLRAVWLLGQDDAVTRIGQNDSTISLGIV